MLADTKKVNPNHIELNNYTENKVIILGIQIGFCRLAMFFWEGGGEGVNLACKNIVKEVWKKKKKV